MKVIKDFKDLSLLRSEILNGNPNGVDILRIDGQAFSTDMQPYDVAKVLSCLPSYKGNRKATLRRVMKFFGAIKQQEIIGLIESMNGGEKEETKVCFKENEVYSFRCMRIKEGKEKGKFMLIDDRGNTFNLPVKIMAYDGRQVKCKYKGLKKDGSPIFEEYIPTKKNTQETKLKVIGQLDFKTGKINPVITKTKNQVRKQVETKSSESKQDIIANFLNTKPLPKYGTKPPRFWVGEVEGFSYHKYGKSFECSCCHRHFGPRQGIKMEMNEEIFFCMECKEEIIQKSSRKYNPIIFTPMGNKR